MSSQIPVFRLANRSELDAVCALYRDAAHNPYSAWDETYPSRDFALRDWEAGKLYVLTLGDAVIGTLSIVPEKELSGFPCWSFSDNEAEELARVAVSRQYQGMGYGSLLVRSVFPVLTRHGCRSVRLSVCASNLPARKIYERLGFAPVFETELYGGHYFLMEKIL